MGKRPSYQWYPGDWKKDPAVQALSPESRAFWREALDVLFESDTKGQLTATREAWSRVTGVPVEWIDTFLSENELARTCDVTVCNGTVTLMSRRILRDERERELTRKRVAKHRAATECNAPVTPMKHDSSSSSSSSSSVTKVTKYTADFETWWQEYPSAAGKSKAQEYFTARLKSGQTVEQLTAARDRYIAIKNDERDPRFSNGSTFLNPHPKGDSANIDDFIDESPEKARYTLEELKAKYGK